MNLHQLTPPIWWPITYTRHTICAYPGCTATDDIWDHADCVAATTGAELHKITICGCEEGACDDVAHYTDQSQIDNDLYLCAACRAEIHHAQ